VGTQNVSIETATPSSTIYYTDDGSEPTASSTLYTGPITVTTTTTFKAIAVKGGLIDSEVTIAGYIITGTPLVDSASPSTVGTEALGNATWMDPNNVSLSDGSNATA